jgi:hypothetical protein
MHFYFNGYTILNFFLFHISVLLKPDKEHMPKYFKRIKSLLHLQFYVHSVCNWHVTNFNIFAKFDKISNTFAIKFEPQNVYRQKIKQEVEYLRLHLLTGNYHQQILRLKEQHG